jgi:uncharacterized protein YheU (UPF0270 family)
MIWCAYDICIDFFKLKNSFNFISGDFGDIGDGLNDKVEYMRENKTINKVVVVYEKMSL